MLPELLPAGWQDVWTDGKAKGAGDLGHIPRWTQTLPATKDTGVNGQGCAWRPDCGWWNFNPTHFMCHAIFFPPVITKCKDCP